MCVYILNIGIASQTLYWLDGNIAYVLTAFQFFIYFYYLYSRLIMKTQAKKYDVVLLPLVAFFVLRLNHLHIIQHVSFVVKTWYLLYVIGGYGLLLISTILTMLAYKNLNLSMGVMIAWYPDTASSENPNVCRFTFSFVERMPSSFDELNGREGILVASKIADRVGITRSVIVNALRKFESAGVIESQINPFTLSEQLCFSKSVCLM